MSRIKGPAPNPNAIPKHLKMTELYRSVRALEKAFDRLPDFIELPINHPSKDDEYKHDW